MFFFYTPGGLFPGNLALPTQTTYPVTQVQLIYVCITDVSLYYLHM